MRFWDWGGREEIGLVLVDEICARISRASKHIRWLLAGWADHPASVVRNAGIER